MDLMHIMYCVLYHPVYSSVYFISAKFETRSIFDFEFSYLNTNTHTRRYSLISRKGFDQNSQETDVLLISCSAR